MITKIYLCSENDLILTDLKNEFESVDNISIENISITDFAKSKKFNLIVYYFIVLAEKFNIKSTKFESQIVNTNNEFGLVKYIVCGPNFTNVNIDGMKIDYYVFMLNEMVKKILEASKDINEDLNVGFHIDILFKDSSIEYFQYKDLIKNCIQQLQTAP